MTTNPQGWSFDARQHSAENAFGMGTVPEAWYKVIVRKSNILPTSDGQSFRLELQCEIIEGEQKGRVIYWNLNLWNKSQQATDIAHRQLTALCQCVGQFDVRPVGGQDSVTPMLHNAPFYLFVVLAPGNQGTPINNVKNIRDVNGNEPGKGAAGPAMAQPAPPNVGPAGGFAPPQTAMVAPGGFTPQPPASAPNGGWATGAPAAPAQAAPAPAQAIPMPPPGQAMPAQPAPGQSWGQPGAPAAPPNAQPWTPGANQSPVPPQAAPAQTWPGQPTQAAPQGGPPPGAAPWGPPR